MMAWTFITGIIYLSRVAQLTYANIHRDADLLQMPDIDRSLMILMGLGQGTYLGKKAATMDSKTHTPVDPENPEAGAIPKKKPGA